MESLNNDNKQDELNVTVHADKPSVNKKTFAQRNKYRIRQVCGVAVLLVLITGTTMMLTKCGSGIDDASSAVPSNASANDSSLTETTTSQTTNDTTSGTTSTTSGETTTSEQTTTATDETTEQTTTEQTTTQETTTKQTTTTEKTTTKETTTKQTTTAKPTETTTKATTAAPAPVGPAKVEVRNGLTYVNGILIANKTYSVPASYNPGIDPNAQAAFNKMQQAAASQGIYLWICSGFRSYGYQQQLYNNYVYRDGKAAADRYSARPGYSEHQTGLAMDINYAGSWFDTTAEAKWLAAHCTDYGFIIRYKPGKESSTGYMAESWHIRYLGDVSLCKSIEASGLSLEEYLGITSVYAN